MENEIGKYLMQLVVSVILLLMYPVTKLIISKFIRKYAIQKKKAESRTVLIIKLCSNLVSTVFILIIITIWGVNPEHILVALSSVFAVIGAGMFAQWSVLSNITAGIILYFNAPFTVGDRIRIHDTDVNEVLIDNILTFHTRLVTVSGEIVVFPNMMLMQKGVTILPPPGRPRRNRFVN